MVGVGKCWQEDFFFSLQGGMVKSVWISCQAEAFLGWHPPSTIETFCLRGSWLAIHAHPMPWPGQPTASWLRAVIGGSWPTGRKATCCRLSTTAVTLRSGNSPQPQQVLEASLSCWAVMTGRSPGQLCRLSLRTLSAGRVVLNYSRSVDRSHVC